MHRKNIIHRDIKTANFLVNDHYICKVIDFGVSRIKEEDLKMTVIGTPGKNFYPPKFFNKFTLKFIFSMKKIFLPPRIL